jgi:MATE family multidrug resistance protein
MLTLDRTRTVFSLATPIAVALSASFVMSLTDLAMVSRLGDATVAAVGLASFTYTLIGALVAGVSTGVQTLVAKRRGEGSTEPACLPLNGGLLIALVIGLPLTGLAALIGPHVLAALSSSDEVTAIGQSYLSILLLGLVALIAIDAFSGHWTGLEQPRVFLLVTLAMVSLNVVLNYALIHGNLGAPALGAQGAAVGTTVSLVAGVVLYVIMTAMLCPRSGFLAARPSADLLRSLMIVAVPENLQTFFVTAGYLVFFWLVGQVGTAELASANVLVRITMAMLLVAIALATVAATLVARTVGEGDIEAAAQWGWDTGKIGVLTISLMGLPMLLFPRLFLSLFLSDPETIEMAVVPLQLTAATTGLGSLIYIFALCLYSVGYGKPVVVVSFSTQWLLFLPGVWIVGPLQGGGLIEIWYVQMLYGTASTVLITMLWARGRWKSVRL